MNAWLRGYAWFATILLAILLGAGWTLFIPGLFAIGARLKKPRGNALKTFVVACWITLAIVLPATWYGIYVSRQRTNTPALAQVPQSAAPTQSKYSPENVALDAKWDADVAVFQSQNCDFQLQENLKLLEGPAQDIASRSPGASNAAILAKAAEWVRKYDLHYQIIPSCGLAPPS